MAIHARRAMRAGMRVIFGDCICPRPHNYLFGPTRQATHLIRAFIIYHIYVPFPTPGPGAMYLSVSINQSPTPDPLWGPTGPSPYSSFYNLPHLPFPRVHGPCTYPLSPSAPSRQSTQWPISPPGLRQSPQCSCSVNSPSAPSIASVPRQSPSAPSVPKCSVSPLSAP